MSSGIRIYQGGYWSAKSSVYEGILALTIEQLPEHAEVLKSRLNSARSHVLLDLTGSSAVDFQVLQHSAIKALEAAILAPDRYLPQVALPEDDYRQFLVLFSLLNAMLKTDPRSYHSGSGNLIVSGSRVWQAPDTWNDLLLEHLAVSVDQPDLTLLLLDGTGYRHNQADLSTLNSTDFYQLADALHTYSQRYSRYVPGMSAGEIFAPLFPCLRELYRLLFFDPRYFHPLVERLVKAPDLEQTLSVMTYLRDQAFEAIESNMFGSLAVIHSAASYFIEYFAGIPDTGADSIIRVAEGLRTSLGNFSRNSDWVDTFPSEEELLEAVDRWVSARS